MNENSTTTQSRPEPAQSNGQPESVHPATSARPRRLVRRLAIALLVVAIAGGYLAWEHFRPRGIGDAFAEGNGRIEAVELDVAAKSPGRISDFLVDEGDFVSAGQVVVRINIDELQAQPRDQA